MLEAEQRSFNEFKDKVYRDIRWLEVFGREYPPEFRTEKRPIGCLGAILSGMAEGVFRQFTQEDRDYRNVDKLDSQAEELLSREDLRARLCKVLDDSMNLPIDVANAVFPVLYKMSGDEIARDSMLFALISKKIADRSVTVYCSRPQ